MSASSNTANGAESRLFRKLEEAIAGERNPMRAACLRAEWASAQARQGRTDIAKSEVAALRKEFEGKQGVELTTWICIVESLAINYENLGESSLDRMKRALALSTSAGLRRLVALSATSLALMAINWDDPEGMERFLRIAFAELEHADDGTIARAYMAVAFATHWAGRLDQAIPWYAAARQHAISHGDDVTLGGLNRHMSALRAAQARIAAIFGEPYEDDARFALATAESTKNFDLQIGNVVYGSVLPDVRASVAVVQGRFHEAIEIYQSLLPRVGPEGLGDTAAHMLAEMAWCFVNIGDSERAREHAQRAMDAHQDSHHGEDQLVEFGRLSQVYESLGDLAARHEFAERAHAALAAHRSLQQKFLNAVANFKSPDAVFKARA